MRSKRLLVRTLDETGNIIQETEHPEFGSAQDELSRRKASLIVGQSIMMYSDRDDIITYCGGGLRCVAAAAARDGKVIITIPLGQEN